MGAQSFHPHELEQLGRCHNIDQISEAVRLAKAVEFENIGLDLIFAIPGSTVESWRISLESAIDLDIRHVSAYSLSFEEGSPMEVARQAGQLQAIDEQTDREMYELTIRTLEQAGFEQYEVSNFARPGFACQHNRGYWLNRPFIGIGPAAASYWQGRRTLNVADIHEYVAAIEAGMDPTAEMTVPTELDRVCETAVLNLRMRDGIDLERFRRQTSRDALEVFAEPIRNYRSLGLIQVNAGQVRLTDEALPIADSVLCDFAETSSASTSPISCK
jgi:oxygen-independent coproporphyrinogen-3 oxidase